MTNPPSPDAARSRALRLTPLLVIVVAWIAHESVRHNGWVLEAVRLVQDDPDVERGPAALGRILTGPWAASDTASGTYGPLVRASFALESPLWRGDDGALSPGGFHLVNLLLHVACALLLLRVLLVILPARPIVAVAAAVVFAAHPLHAGTVGPLMGRGELLALLFSLLCVLAWRAYGGRRPAWLPLSALCWLLAILAKEVAIGLPLGLLVLDLAVPPKGDRPPALRRAAGYAVFLIPLLAFAASWTGPGAPVGDFPAQGIGARLAVGLEGWGRTLLALVVPVGLRGDHTDEALSSAGYVLAGPGLVAVIIVIALTLLALLRVLRRRGGALDVVWLCAAALALPAMLVARIGAPLESRFAYVAAVPLVAGLGFLVESLALRRGRVEPFTLIRTGLAGGLALVCLVGLSQREAGAWRDDETYHQVLLDRNPQHVGAMVRLARAQRMTAQQKRSEASQLRSDDPLRASLLKERRVAIERALAWSRRAVRHELGRASTDAWRERGFAHLAADRSAEALRSLERARSLDPVLLAPPNQVAQRYAPERVHAAAEVYHAMGMAREAVGRREAAADAFVTASQLHPGRVDYLERAGMVLCRVNRYGEGIPLLQEALRRTSRPAARKRLEDAIDDARKSARRIAARYFREGREAEGKGKYKPAVGLYERAAEVNPTLVEAYIRSGWLRGWWFGSYEIAEARLLQARRLLEEGRRRGTINAEDQRFVTITDYLRELAKQKASED